MNTKVNYRWMIVMYRCRFISYSECAILMGDIVNGGGSACVGAGDMWEISVPSA